MTALLPVGGVAISGGLPALREAGENVWAPSPHGASPDPRPLPSASDGICSGKAEPLWVCVMICDEHCALYEL